MDILHLKCLLTVLYTNSFTEAGEIVHLSQSAISKKIIALENEIGIKLIERKGKSIVLTPEGQRMMSHFLGILESYDHAMNTLREIKYEQKNNDKELRIIGVPSISRYNIIPTVENFAKEHPDIDVHVEEMETDRLHLMLQYGDCDLAFCGDILLDHKYYDTQVVCPERFMVATSSKNPLVERKTVRIKDLEHEKFILNRPESQLNHLCIEACQAAGFYPIVVMMTARPAIAYEYLHSNAEYIYMGLRGVVLANDADEIAILPIEDSPKFNFCYVWRKNPGPSKSALLYLKYAEAFHTEHPPLPPLPES
jgi:DNA-binding transcriptional LysR family regulator